MTSLRLEQWGESDAKIEVEVSLLEVGNLVGAVDVAVKVRDRISPSNISVYCNADLLAQSPIHENL